MYSWQMGGMHSTGILVFGFSKGAFTRNEIQPIILTDQNGLHDNEQRDVHT